MDYPHGAVIARAEQFSDYLRRKYSGQHSKIQSTDFDFIPSSSGVDSKLPTPKNSILETDNHGLLRQELSRHLVSQYSFGSNGSSSQSSLNTQNTPIFQDLQNTPPKGALQQYSSPSYQSDRKDLSKHEERETKGMKPDDVTISPLPSLENTPADLPQKKKQSVDDFESLSIIGRGAFGEVRLVRRKGAGEATRDVYGKQFVHRTTFNNDNHFYMI
jgi:hypothetical protein